MADYDVGDVIRLTGTFRDEAGVLGNPDTVTLIVRPPDGVSLDVDATSSSTGIWTATVEPDQAGRWRYRWVGTGGPTAAEEGAFNVRRRRVPEPA